MFTLDIRHLKHTDYHTGTWSGGTTTELFLYPEDGSYAQRNFLVRVSSATVNLPESDFTPLPGVYRYIAPLKGRFQLTHPDGSGADLGPLEVYGFSGGVDTHCVGTATDFNLMLKDCSGDLVVFQETGRVRPGLNCYFPLEQTTLTIDNRPHPLEARDLLVVFVQNTTETHQITATNGPVLHCHAALALPQPDHK